MIGKNNQRKKAVEKETSLPLLKLHPTFQVA
jgi:hypothetical protein